MSSTSSLGNFEESFRPFLGGILSTDDITVPAKARPGLEGHYGSSFESFDYWFVGGRCASMVSRGIQPGSQRKAQSYRFASASGKQRREHNKTAQADNYPVSRSSVTATASQLDAVPKIQFLEPAHSGWIRDVVRLGGCWLPFHGHDLKREFLERHEIFKNET
jgi:hypothetical protein